MSNSPYPFRKKTANNPSSLLHCWVEDGRIEAGIDEAGRGALAGPVVAASVILPPDICLLQLTDSKQLSAKLRTKLAEQIRSVAVAYSVAMCDNVQIDVQNVLQASIAAMHKSIAALSIRPQRLLIDGNCFNAYEDIPHTCIVRGDQRLLSIAAASVLAKVYRDMYMTWVDGFFPQYKWRDNKGYPTVQHARSIGTCGYSPLHRKTFRVPFVDSIEYP